MNDEQHADWEGCDELQRVREDHMTRREELIEKLSDTMDPDNARIMVDNVINEAKCAARKAEIVFPPPSNNWGTVVGAIVGDKHTHVVIGIQTLEQQARDMLDRMGVPNAQHYTAGDVVEIANLIGKVKWEYNRGFQEGVIAGPRHDLQIALGVIMIMLGLILYAVL